MDGSSEANPYIDSSVGALVWVRRRNGSWWPGRILGPEELPGSHLLSPRTGTPVKLLGREDGSVDWYNIEKSRRVKAFRCGDFDECIERAKSLASVLTKKREKYARREDAILHALELEKKHIEQNYLLERSFSAARTYRHMPSFADDDMVLDDDMDGMGNHSDFQSDFMDPDSSADAPQASLDSLFSLQGDKKFLDADWEDDIADTLPRMRGLQDFGLKIASSKERKASWGAAYEHTSHISITDDDQKVASCITKNTVTCPATIASKTSCTTGAVSKRKRCSQAGYIEDESALKKRDRRKPVNSVLESSGKVAADSAIDLGSKASVPYFVPSVGRNGTLLQPKQESNVVMLGNAFQGTSEVKPLTAVCGQEFWPGSQIDSRVRNELLDSSPVLDKACSSFSDHVKSNCCDGRQYLYADSQMEPNPLTGMTFPDPFLQGVPGSRSSMFPRSVYPGSFAGVNDNGFQKAGSLSTPENMCNPLTGFPMWPYYSAREVMFEKFGHEGGLRGQVASSRTVGFPDYSFESTVPNNALPMYSVYNNSLEDTSTFAKNNAGDRDGSLFLHKVISKADILKTPLKSPKQCLSAVAEGDGATDEDEADSFQPPQDTSFGSPKAIGFGDAHFSMKPKHASDGFCDIPGYHELKSTTTRNGFVSTEGLWDGRLDDDVDIHSYARLSNNYSGFPLVPTMTKWQAKGRRGVRVRCRNSWLSPAAGVAVAGIVPTEAVPDVLEEIQEDAEIAPSDLKVKKRTTRGFRYSFNFGSSSEEEDPFKERSASRQPAYQAHIGHVNRLDSGNVPSVDALDVHDPTWFEVPVEEDQATKASCPEHVPLVSMMSMLKGKAIVGYAVHVEIVERRYGVGASRSHSFGNVVRKPPLQQPVWRTGRRTAMQRIPRSCGIVVSRVSEQERQHQPKHGSIQNRGMRKGGLLMCTSAEKRKSSKKLGLVPQKTRMLSSIASEDGTEHDATRNVGPPLVTCIPVNVIFSRIREVLYRGVNHGAFDSDIIS